MSLDDLSGRQLDLAVARHVFGHQVEERPNLRTGEPDAVYTSYSKSSNATWVRVPTYSQSLSASLTVEAELQKRGWTRTEPRERVNGDVRVVFSHDDGRKVEAFGPVNEALCRAALAAVQQA